MKFDQLEYPVSLARNMGSSLITITMGQRHQLGGESIHVIFHGDLFDNQRAAVESLLVHETGVLSATPLSAKRL